MMVEFVFANLGIKNAVEWVLREMVINYVIGHLR